MTAERPSNRELVLYALYTMGSTAKRFHTESIAIRCHELFPTSFSWSTRPELPDKDIVRVALTDARKEKYGSLVEGRSGQSKGHHQETRRGPMSDGWNLTQAGIEWIQHHKQRLENLSEISVPRDHRQKSRKSLTRVRDHILFADFENQEIKFAPGIGQLADLVRCRVDAEPSVWIDRFTKLERLAIETEQDELRRFISACREAYEASNQRVGERR
jgi:hypothetical protein